MKIQLPICIAIGAISVMGFFGKVEAKSPVSPAPVASTTITETITQTVVPTLPVIAAAPAITQAHENTLTVEAPTRHVFIQTLSTWYYVRVTNISIITQHAVLVIDSADVTSLTVNIGMNGSCRYSSDHRNAQCEFDILPSFYWDIPLVLDVSNQLGQWHVTQCVSSGMCVQTYVVSVPQPFPESSIFLPVIAFNR